VGIYCQYELIFLTFNIGVLVVGGGRERSIDDYITLLGSVGLVVSKVIPTKRGPAMIECILK
jgi:hypothetical protein